MTKPLVVRPEAERELTEAREWYRAQRAELAEQFVAAVAAAVNAVCERPLAHPKVRGEIRRAVLRRFPYALYFRDTPEAIVLLAVMHGHRNPRRWLSRR